MREDKKYRIIRQVLVNGKVQFIVQIQFDEGIDGVNWHIVDWGPFSTINDAKSQINHSKEHEPIAEKIIWTE